jgi:TM2 domain-containing membrane protein YozV
MSQSQDWGAPGDDRASHPGAAEPPPADPPPANQGYQPPPGHYGYPPGPYQRTYQQSPYQQSPYPPGYQGPPVVVPKNPGIALLISFFVPGVGSIYAGKTNTGVVILVGYIVSWLLVFVVIGIAGLIGFWVWGLVDAYHAARDWNRARGIEA